MFWRSYQELVKEKVSFPSPAKKQQEKEAIVSAVPAKPVSQPQAPDKKNAKPVVSAHKDNSKAIQNVQWAAELKI